MDGLIQNGSSEKVTNKFDKGWAVMADFTLLYSSSPTGGDPDQNLSAGHVAIMQHPPPSHSHTGCKSRFNAEQADIIKHIGAAIKDNTLAASDSYWPLIYLQWPQKQKQKPKGYR